MSLIPPTNLKEFEYHLPEERIALEPAKERDQSRLLLYRDGQISHSVFKDIVQYLPANAALVFNNTRVIAARLHFTKPTGAAIEIFLLSPLAPFKEIAAAMQAKSPVTWQCMVGNLKKWKNEPLKKSLVVQDKEILLQVDIKDRAAGEIVFSWSDQSVSFSEIIEATGETPLPPYIKRKAEEKDKEKYQTVYSLKKGAVAAPTAGLHFSKNVLEQIKQKGISTSFVTLHVSAGTFQPIKGDDIQNHPMHQEQIIVPKATIEKLTGEEFVVAVGTTSVRTLESLYWYGVKILLENDQEFFIEKGLPYKYKSTDLPSKAEAFSKVIEMMEKEGLNEISGITEIFIVPGYNFKICKALITNFHLPGSTLILLVAAFVGADWKKIYNEALANNYRFLSYGDSSLLMGNEWQ